MIETDSISKQLFWSLFNSLGTWSITQRVPTIYPSGVVNGYPIHINFI